MQEFTVTSGALPGSEKIYVKGELFNVRVPMRKIKLSDTLDADGKRIANEAVVVYDTSGPYTDPDYAVDLRKIRGTEFRIWEDAAVRLLLRCSPL